MFHLSSLIHAGKYAVFLEIREPCIWSFFQCGLIYGRQVPHKPCLIGGVEKPNESRGTMKNTILLARILLATACPGSPALCAGSFTFCETMKLGAVENTCKIHMYYFIPKPVDIISHYWMHQPNNLLGKCPWSEHYVLSGGHQLGERRGIFR